MCAKSKIIKKSKKMEKKNFELFIKKLEINTSENPSNLEIFSELEKECLELLECFVRHCNIDFQSMRILTHFKLQITRICRAMLIKKNPII